MLTCRTQHIHDTATSFFPEAMHDVHACVVTDAEHCWKHHHIVESEFDVEDLHEQHHPQHTHDERDERKGGPPNRSEVSPHEYGYDDERHGRSEEHTSELQSRG